MHGLQIHNIGVISFLKNCHSNTFVSYHNLDKVARSKVFCRQNISISFGVEICHYLDHWECSGVLDSIQVVQNTLEGIPFEWYRYTLKYISWKGRVSGIV